MAAAEPEAWPPSSRGAGVSRFMGWVQIALLADAFQLRLGRVWGRVAVAVIFCFFFFGFGFLHFEKIAAVIWKSVAWAKAGLRDTI